MSSSEGSYEEVETPRNPTSTVGLDVDTATRSSGLQLAGNLTNGCTRQVSDAIASDLDLVLSLKNARGRRDSLVRRRLGVAYQRKNYGYQRKHASESLRRFHEAAKVFLERHSIDPSFDPEYQQLEQSFIDFVGFNKTLDQTEEVLQKEDKDLNIREDELLAEENKVYKRLNQITAVRENPKRRIKPSRRAPPSVRSSSTQTTDPRAREYYDRTGAVKHLRDILHNVQVQHHHDNAIREGQKELGQTPSPTDKEFIDTYHERLARLLAELSKAKKEARSAKRFCRKHQVPFEEDGDEDLLDKAEALQFNSDIDRKIFQHAAIEEDEEQRAQLLDKYLSNYLDSNTKVNSWLENLTSDTSNQNGAAQTSSWSQDPHRQKLSKVSAPLSIQSSIHFHVIEPISALTSPEFHTINGDNDHDSLSSNRSRRSGNSLVEVPENDFARLRNSPYSVGDGSDCVVGTRQSDNTQMYSNPDNHLLSTVCMPLL
jgi:hypothetical protein